MNPEDDPGPHGRGVAASDENEEDHEREEDRVADLAADAKGAQAEHGEPAGERDVKAGNHEHMVEASAPEASDHPAFEL